MQKILELKLDSVGWGCTKNIGIRSLYWVFETIEHIIASTSLGLWT